VTYVGLWLAHGSAIDNLRPTVSDLLEGNRSINFCFLDPDVPSEYLDALATYLALTPTSLRAHFGEAVLAWRAFKHELPPNLSGRFRLLTHRELVTSSVFIIDEGADTAKTLVDFKLFTQGRDQSFGIELRPCRTAGSLYERVNRSFGSILAKATDVPAPSTSSSPPTHAQTGDGCA
jgi:hypothetical protein